MEVRDLRYEDNVHIIKVKLGKLTGHRPSYTNIYKDGNLFSDHELNATLLSNEIIKGKVLTAVAIPHSVQAGITVHVVVNYRGFGPFEYFVDVGNPLTWMSRGTLR